MIWTVDPWWAVFVAAALWWLPQNVIHEGSHALKAKKYGATIVEFWPFPGRIDGRFAFAYVTWKDMTGYPGPAAGAEISIAPLKTNTALFLILLIVVTLGDGVLPSILMAALVGLAITNYVDGAYSLSTFYRSEPAEEDKYSDGWRFQQLNNYSVRTMRLFAIFWQLLFALCLLLPWTSYAQDPVDFDPIPFDAQIEGVTYPGILVDETTFSELGELRVAVATKDAELMAFEEWRQSHEMIFSATVGELKTSCVEGQDRLTAHYEGALERERKKDFIQRHGFPLGVAVGIVGATVVYLGAVHLYGEVLTVNL